MKVAKIADKILISMYKRFIETGERCSCAEKIVSDFPEYSPHLIYAALDMLYLDNFLSVLYANDEPTEISLNVQAMQRCDENTLLKRGYNFLKELRDWL